MGNYFNALPLRTQLEELGTCRFMDASEFEGVEVLKGKKIVIVGCGAQGLSQGLNLRDSGLNVSYALRDSAIAEKRPSWKNARDNGFTVGNYEQMIPTADLLINLAPDKQHSSVVAAVMPLMKQYACLSYSHGFNIVEEGMKVREDLTVIMVAPKAPGSEVRAEYKRGFGVPTLIAVHRENNPGNEGLDLAKAYACGIGADRAGVLHSSFIAEVKSDLMGEQTILVGMLQACSLLCFDKMVAEAVDAGYAAKLIQYGWETITEALKHGGITNMMDRLSNPGKIRAYYLSEEIKKILFPLFVKHMDDIMSGEFSMAMMEDWADDDRKLLAWRAETAEAAFEKAECSDVQISEQEYFDKGILMVAIVKAGVELAFDIMVSAGIREESAYYESLHELPLIANTIARRRLHEMNVVISDTAEYGSYLFTREAVSLLGDFMRGVGADVIGEGLDVTDNSVNNIELIAVNAAIRNTTVEQVGEKLRSHMSAMKPIL